MEFSTWSRTGNKRSKKNVASYIAPGKATCQLKCFRIKLRVKRRVGAAPAVRYSAPKGRSAKRRTFSFWSVMIAKRRSSRLLVKHQACKTGRPLLSAATSCEDGSDDGRVARQYCRGRRE